jgi:DNA polymerase-3 subunit epsilon
MRTSHNALLDVKLLAEVYLQLMGGKQPGFDLAAATTRKAAPVLVVDNGPLVRTPRPIIPSEAELAAHAAFVETKLKDALWLKPPFAEPLAEGDRTR